MTETTDSKETNDDMNCGLSVAERDLLQMKLGDLEDTVPPRDVWQRIEAQARAEGFFHRRVRTESDGLPARESRRRW